MARWQDLFDMLLDENLSPHQIVKRLDVKPSRLRRLVTSKRLVARLRIAESVADRKAGHKVVAAIDSAANKLAALTAAERPETARRACLDILEKAREIYQNERQEYRRTRHHGIPIP